MSPSFGLAKMAEAGAAILQSEAPNGTWVVEIGKQSVDKFCKTEITRKTESIASKGKVLDQWYQKAESPALSSDCGAQVCRKNMEPYCILASEVEEQYESSLPSKPSENENPNGICKTEAEGQRSEMGEKDEEHTIVAGDSKAQGDEQAGAADRGDEGVALWAKWRGRWEPCIQCYMDDCPSATARSMPTYSKKTYIVVFFPNTRKYSWIDLQHVCSISDKPLPLASGSHLSGRELVKDVSLPKYHMLRCLAASVLDISDRMPIKAVVEGAQFVEVWRAFAAEAGQAKQYSDIGKLLVRLFEMIMRIYLKKSWLETSFSTWHANCLEAQNAQAVERLNQELVDAILWDDISILWDAPEQSNLGPEWKNWKGPLFERKDMPVGGKIQPSPTSSYSDVGEMKNEKSDLSSNCQQPFSQDQWPIETFELGSREVSRKRSKLEIRRKGSTFLSPTNVASRSEMKSPGDTVHVANSGNFVSLNMKNLPASETKGPEDMIQVANSGANLVSLGMEDLSASLRNATGQLITENENILGMSEEKTPTNSQHCAAYLAKKQRHCIRFPNQGSRYCSKHIDIETDGKHKDLVSLGQEDRNADSLDVDGPSTLAKVEGPVCEGMTKYGRQCTHRAKIGSLFCKKHTIDDAPHIKKENHSSTDRTITEKMVASLEGQKSSTSESKKPSTLPRKRKSISSLSDKGRHESDMLPQQLRWSWNSESKQRCIGHRVDGAQCSHRAKPGSYYCEKHAPEVGSFRGHGQASESGRKRMAREAKANEWLNKYLESASNMTSENTSQLHRNSLNWILEEASKDISTAETLLRIVTEQKERLGQVLSLQDDEKELPLTFSGSLASPTTPICADLPNNADTAWQTENVKNDIDSFSKNLRCSICFERFTETLKLREHWICSHSLEAHGFLKGFVCSICNFEFADKAAIDGHKDKHECLTENPMYTACRSCDKTFVNLDALWDHVVVDHLDCLTSASPAVGSIAMVEDGKASEGVENTSVSVKASNTMAADTHNVTGDAVSADVVLHDASALKSSIKEPADPSNLVLKYKCRFCGQKFRLLPDLGRHHQAEHMLEANSSVKGVGKNGHSRKRKGTLNGMKPQGKSSKHENESLRRIKASIQKGGGKQNNSPICIPSTSNGMVMPSNDNILAAACTACCGAQLFNNLGRTYGALSTESFAVAIKFVKDDLGLPWACEGYVCPKGCRISSKEELSVEVTGTSGVTDGNPVNMINKKLKHVLSSDISFGQEAVPVPCVMDDDVMQPCTCLQCKDGKASQVESLKPWEKFKYITRRLLDPSLGLDMKNSQLGCSCETPHCSPKSCDHVYFFDNDNSGARDVYGKQMRGRFSYDENGRIILQEGYLVYECNTSCHCQEDCQNRVLQRGVRVKLEVFKTRHKGWAVRAAETIPRGTFVCEYVGEVLDDVDANKRGERYDQVGCSYLYDIDVHLDGSNRSRRGAKPFVVDATHFGNVSRFINHSCAPNLVNYQVLVESMDCQLAHIGLYASTDIAIGEELAYDYRYKLLPGKGCPCHCGAPTCRGRLY